MKNIIHFVSLILLISLVSCTETELKNIGKEVSNTINGNAGLTNDEVIKGLKEALTVGSNNSSLTASHVDGYYKNAMIKILFPPEAATMEQKLREIGLNQQVDNFVMSLNRAAEDAAKQAAPVFKNAVTGMSIADGFAILRGADTAATAYLRKTTFTQLHDRFKPVIQSAIQQAGVSRYWNPLFTAYDKIPFVTKVNPDLDEYVTGRALSGLFYLVSQEEVKIRKDPAARITDLLKKVFGSK